MEEPSDIAAIPIAGQKNLYEVGRFALAMLALPFSNAAVERVFSQMNIIKTKRRNCMKQLMLESIIYIAICAHMVRNKICRHMFKVTPEKLVRHRNDMCEAE